MNRKIQRVKQVKVGLGEVSPSASAEEQSTKPSQAPSVIYAVASSASAHSQQVGGIQTGIEDRVFTAALR